MGATEYILLVLVILIPLVLAVMVTLWSIKQASFRSKKNRKQWQPPVVPVRDETAVGTDEAVSNSSSD